LAIPDDLGKSEIRNLDLANSTSTNARNKLTLVGLVLVIRASRLGVSGWHKRCGVEEQVFGFDITVGFS
jgi:hypothetical protein